MADHAHDPAVLFAHMRFESVARVGWGRTSMRRESPVRIPRATCDERTLMHTQRTVPTLLSAGGNR